MLEEVPDLTLAMLNEATQAWVELEYNRKLHSEIGEAPVARFLKGPEVTRQSPDSAALRLAFTRTEQRTQRKRRPWFMRQTTGSAAATAGSWVATMSAA